jgi:hypothetical protein
MGEKMTSDLIQTRRQYRAVYTNWPSELIVAHLIVVDCKVEEMKSDDMIEARALMDLKIPQWKENGV